MPNNAPTKKVIPTIKRGSGLSELDLLMTGRSKANRRGGSLGPTDATILAVDEIEARLHRRTLLAPLEQKIAGLQEEKEQLQQDIEFQKSKLYDNSGSNGPGSVSLSPDLDPGLTLHGNANLDPVKAIATPTPVVEVPSQLPSTVGESPSDSLSLVPLAPFEDTGRVTEETGKVILQEPFSRHNRVLPWQVPSLALLQTPLLVTQENPLSSKNNFASQAHEQVLVKPELNADPNQSALIEQTLNRLGVEVTVREVNVGPTITQYALEPGPKIKVRQIAALADDLALALAVSAVRLELPVPGKSLVGLEVPNRNRRTVSLAEVMASAAFEVSKGQLKLALGQAVDGQPVVADLTTMPHLLIGGSTGAGKSVFLNSLIAALLLQYTPDELQLVMIDPKLVELTPYNGIPHLLFPVITKISLTLGSDDESDSRSASKMNAVSVLDWALEELERRKQLLAQSRQRNIQSYNSNNNPSSRLPYLVIIIDELANLMLSVPTETEEAIVRLAQEARAFGIHLIVSTQRPSVDIVTGLIKANLPTRISFAVSSHGDSRVILDTVGAEKLLGRGDMLYDDASSGAKPRRVQGVYVSDTELDRIIEWWQLQNQNQTAGLQPHFGFTASDVTMAGASNLPKAVTITSEEKVPATITLSDSSELLFDTQSENALCSYH